MMLMSKVNGPILSLTTTSISTSPLLQPPSLSTCFLASHQHNKSKVNITCNNSRNPIAPTIDKIPSYQPKIANENENENEDTSKDKDKDEDREKFDWYAQWYPVMPVCDLDKTKPHAKRVMGVDIVVWWDRTESQWKVFDDLCPHRFAPLSEGRIDPAGRLQCVYHGWCFNGSGRCELIPQAPIPGPQVHTSKRACVSVYPSTVQNKILWFWPNSNPQFKDILQEKQPPFLPELDDPSYITYINHRDINYGYEVLTENLMDPSHLPYAHYGIIKSPPPKVKVDEEGGCPLNLSVTDMNINGFSTKHGGKDAGKFFAPCVIYLCLEPPTDGNDNEPAVSSGIADKVASATKRRRAPLIFFCVPVSPGKSRLIAAFPTNSVNWIDQFIPRWLFHVDHNLILDSDLYLVHVQERKIREFGSANCHKSYFVPTKADAIPVGYRRWLNKYSQGKVDWGSKFNGGALPPTPPRDELLDRYWTHVVNCSSCSVAYKRLNMVETALQVIAFGLIGVVGLTRQGLLTTIQRSTIFAMAILCFAGSKWLSCFIYKSFHFHDYNHASLIQDKNSVRPYVFATWNNVGNK